MTRIRIWIFFLFLSSVLLFGQSNFYQEGAGLIRFQNTDVRAGALYANYAGGPESWIFELQIYPATLGTFSGSTLVVHQITQSPSGGAAWFISILGYGTFEIQPAHFWDRQRWQSYYGWTDSRTRIVSISPVGDYLQVLIRP
jgi:hypothetical protein